MRDTFGGEFNLAFDRKALSSVWVCIAILRSLLWALLQSSALWYVDAERGEDGRESYVEIA